MIELFFPITAAACIIGVAVYLIVNKKQRNKNNTRLIIETLEKRVAALERRDRDKQIMAIERAINFAKEVTESINSVSKEQAKTTYKKKKK